MFISAKFNPSGFGLMGIVIAVAVIGLLAGGGLYFKETQKQKSLIELGLQKEKEAEVLKQKILQQQKERLESIGEGNNPKPTSQPTPRPTAGVDTSNWKTYRNEKYGFEVRYPPDWSLTVDTTNAVQFKNSAGGEIDVFPGGYHAGDLDVSSCVSKKLNVGGRNIKQEDCSFGSTIRFDPPPSHIPYFVVSFNPKKIDGDFVALDFEKFISTFKFTSLEK